MPAVVDVTKMYLSFGALGEHRTIDIVRTTRTTPISTTNVTKAIRGKVGWRIINMLSSAMVIPECVYSVPVDLAAGPFKPGDTITDSAQVDGTIASSPGVSYIIQHVELDEGFWMLYCFNPKLSYNLYDTVQIYTYGQTITDLGTRYVGSGDVSVFHANEPARIQPSSSQWAIQHGRVGDKKLFDVFIANDYDIKPSRHLLSWVSGSNSVYADVVDVLQREKVDTLMQIVCEQRIGVAGTT